MQKLGATASAAGVALDDGVVKAAAEAQRQIDEASAKASGKFLAALQGLAPPVAALKVQFYGVVEEIADAIIKTEQFVRQLEDARNKTQKLGSEAGGILAAAMKGAKVGPINDYPRQQSKLPDLDIYSEAGASRARYAARDEDADKTKKAPKENSDALNAARKEIDDEISEIQRGLSRKEKLFAQEASLFIISQDQKIAATRKAVDEEYATEHALLQKEVALAGQKPAQVQAINDKIKALDEKHADELVKLNFEAAQQAVKPWHDMINAMGSSLQSSIMGFLEGTTKLRQAVQNMARAIVGEFVKMGVEMVATWAKGIAGQIALSMAGEQAKTAAAGTGTAERVAIAAGGALGEAATSIAGIVKSILAYAAEAGAGAAAFSAPFTGPGAVGVGASVAAGVAALAGSLPRFDKGSWELPSMGNFDGKGGFPALVHPGEMIIPAGPAAAVRSAAKGGGDQGAAAPGGDVHLHVHAMDAQSVTRLFQNNGRDFAKIIAQQFNQNPSLRPSY
jgi:hypothetical protein